MAGTTRRRKLGVVGVVALIAVLLVGAGDEPLAAVSEDATTVEEVAEPEAEVAETPAEDAAAAEEPAPAEEPAEQDAAVAEERAGAAEETAPAEDPVPSEEAATAEVAAAPAGEPAPVEEPVAAEPAPVEEAATAAEEPAPAVEEPAPAAEEPAPAEEPVAAEPALVEEAATAAEEPAPAQVAAAPEEEAAPAEEPTDATQPAAKVAAPTARAPDKIEGKTHQGQLSGGSYTSGSVTQYSEGDSINFRFTLTGNNPNLSGQMQIEFSKEDAGCAFFEPSLVLGTHDGSNPAVVPVSGTAPTVALSGGVFTSGTDWVQKINVSTTDANTEAVIYYYLTITDNVAGCTGASQHSRLNESATPGDFTKTGLQNVPVPANQVIRLPEITVNKLIDRDGDGTFESTAAAGEYEFTLDGSTTLQTDANGQVVFMNVQPDGNHTITESQIDFSSGTYEYDSGSGVNCTFHDPSETATANVAAGTINAVQHAQCTFNNRVVGGNIVVEKQTLPDGSSQQFSFTPSYGAAFQLSDGQTNGSGPLVPGNYSVAETVPAGWVLTSATCDDGSAPGNITLASAETVTCTFTNTQDGKIVVEKQTLPDGDLQTFDFSGDLNGTIGDGGMLMDDVAPGQYTVTEDNIPAGWNLTGITCDDANSAGNVGNATATFNVEPGETVKCTFTNTRDGKIIVEKQTLPDGDPEQFDFSGDLAGTIGDGGMLMDDVAPGQYTVTEDNIPAGWTLASVNCDDLNSVGDAANATATFNVEPGETVTCTFNNTNLPTIVVQKQTLPDGDPGTFDFSGAINATLGDGDSDLAVVAVGQHQVTETVPAGWVLTSIVCDDNDSTGDTNTGTATFNVSAGEVVTCVFTNTKDGSITVEKQTLPGGDPQQFDFAGDLAGQIPDGGSISLPVQPGQYSTTETVPGGWALTDITCSDANSSGNTNTGQATFNVEAGEHVTCVFTNTKDGSITVEKQTDPDGSGQQFTFSGDLAGQIPDNGSISLPVQPGQYSTTETVPAGWQLTGIACSDGNSVGDTNTATAIYDVSAGEHVTCVFTNTQEGSVTIVKDALPPDGTDFAFDGAFGPFELDDDADATLPDSVTFGGLLPGTYPVTETVPAGWQLIGLACDDQSLTDLAAATATIDLAAGEDVTCTFTNRQLGRIVVEKVTAPAGSAQQFTFVPSYGPPFQLSDGQSNSSPLLAAGQYSVSEQVPAGWALTAATCDDGSAPGAIQLDPGETVTCTFNNTQDGQIVVEKQTLPDGSAQTFDFTGDVVATLGDGGQAAAAVQPGSYEVGETVPAGWALTDITCDDNDSSGNLGTAVATFNVGAGEVVTCVFTNTQDGRIIVQKQTDPPGTGQLFAFTGVTNASIPDNGQILVDIAPGTHVMEEQVPNGWQLTGIACDDANSSGDTVTGEATFEIEPGETVTCVFTNTQEGSITIVKDALPADGTDFSFDGSFGSFSLDDDADATLPDAVTFGGLLPGQYDVTETVPAGWELIGLACDDQSPTDLAAATANIGLTAGEDVTCTFTNRQFGQIVVEKVTDPADSTQSFTFAPSYGAPFQLTDGQSNSSGFLATGQYSVAEQVPPGWVLTDATCDDGSDPSAIDLGVGETVTCTFTNTQDGQIVVEKQTLPDGVAGSFEFAGDLVAMLGDGETASVAVQPGQYTATETVPSDWALQSIECDDADSSGDVATATATFEVDAGEVVTCTFTNANLPSSIVVTKTADPTSVPETGGDVTFTVVVANTSTDDTVTIESVVDNVFGDVSSSCQPALPHDLVPQSTLTCSFTEFVSGPAAADHRNVVTATGEDDDGNPVTGSDDAVVDLTPVIDLAVTADFDPDAVVLDFDPAADADEQSVLTATVTNEGPSPASGVEAEIRLPDGVTYLSHTGDVSGSATTADYDPATGALVIGDLAVGATVTLRITVSVDEVGGHVAVNEIMKANEPDVDSTPANGVLAEDDQDDALVTASQVAASGIIGDTVFRDDDKDGVQDPGEPGIAGVSVVLTNVATGEQVTVVTDANGKYLFPALPPGEYRVTVLLGTVPAGFTATTATQVTVTLAENQQFLDADFGFAAPPPQVLPRTGLDSGGLTALGLLLLALGALLARAGRRRPRAEELAAHPLPLQLG